MSLRTLETAILAELRTVTGQSALRLKDIQEWSTTPVKAQGAEVLAFLPALSIHVAYLEGKAKPS
jgi:hypothetical protein